MALSLPGNWHDDLRNHDIFKASNNLAKPLSFSQQRQHWDTPSVDQDPFQFQRQQRVVALRTHDLFVAVGSEVRVLNLAEAMGQWTLAAEEAVKSCSPLNQNWLKEAPYKVLVSPALDFTILSLTLNHDSRFLAVTGKHRVVVLRLPESFSKSSTIFTGHQVLCKSYQIGENYYGDDRRSIVKVAWHPLSQHNAHILVLDDKSMLRMYGFHKDAKEPEWHADLSHEADAVSFALGGESQDTSGWEPFTVFYTLRNGHIYALCPVLPSKSVIRREHLQGLACLTGFKLSKEHDRSRSQKNNTEEAASDAVMYNLRKLQCRWVYETMAISQPSPLYDGRQCIVSNAFPFPLQRQGPFKEVRTSSPPRGEACDMMYITTKPSSVIAVAYTDGEVRHYLLGIGEVEPQWRVTGESWEDKLDATLASYVNIRDDVRWKEEYDRVLSLEVNLPAISLFETFTVSAIRGAMSFVLDQSNKDSYYVYHASGAHVVVMSNWMDLFRKLDESWIKDNSAERERNAWRESRQTSEFHQLVKSVPLQNSESEPIVGLIKVEDAYLSKFLITLSRSYNPEVVCLEDLEDDIPRLADLLNQTNAKETQASAAPSPLAQPFEPPKIPVMPKMNIPAHFSNKNEVVITEESLRFLADRYEEFLRQIAALKKKGSAIKYRLQVQKVERERQVMEFQDLISRLKKCCSEETIQSRQSTIKQLEETQFLQKLALFKILRYTIERFQPQLTEQEEQCFKELSETKEKLDSEDGYQAQIKKLRNDFEQLQVMQAKKTRDMKSKVPHSTASVLLKTITELTSKISETKTKSKELEHRLEQISAKPPLSEKP